MPGSPHSFQILIVNDFIAKTLAGISETLERTLFAADMAHRSGFLQDLDPRAKVIAAIILLITVSFTRHLLILVVLYGLTIFLAHRSAIPLKHFIKRVWLFLPFFTGIIALPAIFNFVTPGTPILTIINITSPRLYVSITVPGVISATFLILRVAVSVSLVLLLILTTVWTDLLKALTVLGIPDTLVAIIGMTQRYVYVLIHTVNNMFLSRRSRLVGRVSGKENRAWVASTMGALLGKSFALSEAVYLSMQSRGYQNRIVSLTRFRLRPIDWEVIGGSLVILIVIILFA